MANEQTTKVHAQTLGEKLQAMAAKQLPTFREGTTDEVIRNSVNVADVMELVEALRKAHDGCIALAEAGDLGADKKLLVTSETIKYVRQPRSDAKKAKKVPKDYSKLDA